MALTWDVSCKFCKTPFQIYDHEAHNLTMVGEKPICSDECFDKHYSDDCQCAHCERYRKFQMKPTGMKHPTVFKPAQPTPWEELQCTLMGIRGWAMNLKEGCSDPKTSAQRVLEHLDHIEKNLKPHFVEVAWKE